MLACISPSYTHYEETLNTLKYAARARKIQNPAKRNIKDGKKSIAKVKKLISDLKVEISSLKDEIRCAQTEEGPDATFCMTSLSHRRNSMVGSCNYNFNSDDFLEVLCCTKTLTKEQNKIRTLKKMLKFEFSQLQKLLFESQENTNDKAEQKKAEECKMYFEEFLLTVKDRVRLANNRKAIQEAIEQDDTKEDSGTNEASRDIDFKLLLEQNQIDMEANQKESNELMDKILSRINTDSKMVTIEDRSPTAKENQNFNFQYFRKRELEIQKNTLDMKMENLQLKQYLSELKSKYSDDTEMRKAWELKSELAKQQIEKQKAIDETQTQIFLKNKELISCKKEANSNLNSLVIHFQAEMLNEVSRLCHLN